MGNLAQDVLYVLRGLKRSPGFAAAIIATLAIGIGANTAIFSVVRGVLLRPLPYGNGDRVALLWGSNVERGWLRFGASLQDFVDWRDGAETFEEMAAYWSGQGNLSAGDRPERATYAMVSPSLFQVLGTGPAQGRAFTPEENLPGNDTGVLISHSLWQRVLGGRPDAIGRSVRLDGRRLEIVGIMPPGFAFPGSDVDVWKTFGGHPDEFGGRGARWVGVIGALAPGVALQQAGAELNAIAGQLEASYPESNTGWRVFLEPLLSGLVAEARPTLLAIWAAVGLVLLIASANVANLTLARARRREGELATRAAIGAGRGRLIRQLLTESLVFAALGGASGLVLALVGVPVLAGLAPADIPRLEDLSIDATVLGFTAGLTLLTGLACGALPAWRITGRALGPALRSGGRGLSGVRRRRARSSLVVAEIALAMVVLVAAGLTLRSFARLLDVDPGFEPQGRLTLRVAPSMRELPDRDAAKAFYDRLIERIGALPGVRSVAAVNVLPPAGGSWWYSNFWVEGRDYAAGAMPVANARVVAGDYFETMGISLIRGHVPDASDRAGVARPLVIDRLAAEMYWPDQDPIGRRISFSDPKDDEDDGQPDWYEVVAIVSEVRHDALDTPPTPLVYMTLDQATFGHFQDWGMTLVLRTDGDPLTLAAPARSEVAELAPELPVFQVRTLRQAIARNVAQRRFAMILLTCFGGVALLVAAVGVYGVLSYVVAERMREIGMRMALGADRGRILTWVLRRGMAVAAAGLALGLGLAIAASRIVSALLYEISPTDPITLAAIAALLAIVALAACLVPAARAARVDPVEALRES